MFSSGELVEATLRLMRRGRSIRPPRPAGEFPPGWDAWFDDAAAAARPSPLPVEQLVAVALAREPQPRKGYARFGTFGAFIRLWRHDWGENDAPDRRTRRLSMGASVLLHLVWLQLMILLTVASFPGEEEAERLGETVTQVEFIGEGTPQEEGGGAQQAEQPEPAVAASQSPAPSAAPAAAAQVSPPPSPPAQAEPRPEPEQVPAPVAEQPLEVSEPVQPEPEFALVEPRIDALPTPALPAPELQVPTPEIQVVEVPVVAPPEVRPLPQREIAVPDVDQPRVDIVERTVPAPAPVVDLQAPATVPAAPELQRDGPAIAEHAIELEAPEPGSGRGQAEASATQAPPAAGGESTAGGTTAGGTRASGEGASPTATTAGAGLESAPQPGALPSPRRGDDWGDSTRNVPGGQAGSPSGLFDAQGRPRLAGNSGRVGGGLPPGTITEDYEKIDRMGTWLKRPPIGYEPTAFDRFWVPHENLLEEWVRRSIKEVLIPIPGTGKRIRCTVAMLMLGGACGITDPDMVDIDADATAPPDVPFKRELQENQDSL